MLVCFAVVCDWCPPKVNIWKATQHTSFQQPPRIARTALRPWRADGSRTFFLGDASLPQARYAHPTWCVTRSRGMLLSVAAYLHIVKPRTGKAVCQLPLGFCNEIMSQWGFIMSNLIVYTYFWWSLLKTYETFYIKCEILYPLHTCTFNTHSDTTLWAHELTLHHETETVDLEADTISVTFIFHLRDNKSLRTFVQIIRQFNNGSHSVPHFVGKCGPLTRIRMDYPSKRTTSSKSIII